MRKISEMSEAVEEFAGAPVPEGEIGKLAKAVRVKPVPVHQDPKQELHRLVQQHKNEMKTAVRLTLMQTDRELEDGTVIENTLPDDVRADLKAASAKVKKHCNSLESAMTRELRRVDVYQLFLSKVYGCGPVVSSYLIAMIRTERLNKVSNLRRYCGYACDESGRLERRSGGPKFDPQGVRTEGTGTFNDDIRRCIWQMFSAMWKNAAKKSEKALHGSTTKYLTRWREAKAGALAVGMPKGNAHSKGMHKAADLFIEDLYTVLCALAGLPIWPSWYAMKLGFYHGGKVCVNQPKLLSVEEAVALVGNVGSTPLAKPAGDEADEVEEEVAAE